MSNLTCDTVTFAWNAATDNVGVAFYDVYHDGQQMKSVSGTTLSTTLTVVAGRDLGPVRQRPRRRRQRLPGQHDGADHPAAVPDRHPGADRADRADRARASGTTVTLSWTAATDNIGVRAYDVYRGGAKVGTVTGTAAVPPGDHLHRQRAGRQHDLPVLRGRRATRRATSRRTATPSTVTTGAACGNSVCAVTQVATDTDIPWGLVTLPDGTILYSRRDAHDIVHLEPGHRGEDHASAPSPTCRAPTARAACIGLADLARPSPPTTGCTSCTPRRPTTGSCGSSWTDDKLDTGLRAGPGQRDPAQQVPQRRAAAVRPRRQALRQHRRRAERRQRPEHDQPQRQGPAAEPGRQRARRTTRSATTCGATATATRRAWRSTRRAGCGSRSSATRSWTRPTSSPRAATTAGRRARAPPGPAARPGTSRRSTPTRRPTARARGIAIVRDVLYVACERGTRMYREVISGSDADRRPARTSTAPTAGCAPWSPHPTAASG